MLIKMKNTVSIGNKYGAITLHSAIRSAPNNSLIILKISKKKIEICKAL